MSFYKTASDTMKHVRISQELMTKCADVLRRIRGEKTRITDTDLLNVALLWFDKTGSGEYGKALTDRAYAEWDARQNKQIQETTVNAVVAICGFLELPCTVEKDGENGIFIYVRTENDPRKIRVPETFIRSAKPETVIAPVRDEFLKGIFG